MNGIHPNPGLGQGVYDGDKWAVVFRYSSVTIPQLTTVRFKNHPSHAPVIWLVTGDVDIGGGSFVELDGSDGVPGQSLVVESGPGGFRGGRRALNGFEEGGGFGPGGGPSPSPGRGNGGELRYASERIHGCPGSDLRERTDPPPDRRGPAAAGATPSRDPVREARS